jgi:hypothetical protein
MNLSGWEIDIQSVYGRLWAKRAQFHLDERLFESPSGQRAVLLFGIGEVGMNKQVGRLALLADKASPRVVFHAGSALFWFEGQSGEAVAFSDDGCRARVFQFRKPFWRRRAFECRPRTLDCDAGALLDG